MPTDAMESPRRRRLACDSGVPGPLPTASLRFSSRRPERQRARMSDASFIPLSRYASSAPCRSSWSPRINRSLMAPTCRASTTPASRRAATHRSRRTADRPSGGWLASGNRPMDASNLKPSTEDESSGSPRSADVRPPHVCAPSRRSKVPVAGPRSRPLLESRGPKEPDAPDGGVWLRKASSQPVKAGGECSQTRVVPSGSDANDPDRTSSATSPESRSGSMDWSMVWLRSRDSGWAPGTGASGAGGTAASAGIGAVGAASMFVVLFTSAGPPRCEDGPLAGFRGPGGRTRKNWRAYYVDCKFAPSTLRGLRRSLPSPPPVQERW
mmetsp:Transcript_20181/g.60182  ORF Transcript_20181/g.60182 Transcript_20181/m.60182 type:complete len:325 (+) Transcript_20181:488-1462(+)